MTFENLWQRNAQNDTEDIFHITAKHENKQDKNMKTKFHVKINVLHNQIYVCTNENILLKMRTSYF